MIKLKLLILTIMLLLWGCRPYSIEVVPVPIPVEPISFEKLEIHMIDVNQGDAILIVTPSKKTILIDTGSKKYVQQLIDYLKAMELTTIDILMITHPHEDHVGGAVDIMNQFEVKQIMDSGHVHTTQTYTRYLEAILEKDIAFTIAKRGMRLDLDEAVVLSILHPNQDYSNNINDSSIVLSLQFKEFSALFTGDAEVSVENQLLDLSLVSKIDVLKVGHHGSRTSSSLSFLQKLSPSIALISVGADNRYNHPHQEVIDRLLTFTTTIYQSDLHGHVKISTNGKTINTVSQKQP